MAAKASADEWKQIFWWGKVLLAVVTDVKNEHVVQAVGFLGFV